MTVRLQDRLQQHFNKQPSAWKENLPFALWLVDRFKPDVVLDLGVDWGHSTMCWANDNSCDVYGVDTWEPNSYSTVGHNFDYFVKTFSSFKSREIPNMHLIKKDHRVCESTWDRSIDIIHFDILHDYEGVKQEYALWKSHVRSGGVFVFHDLLSFPEGCGKFFAKDLTMPRVSFNNQYGLGVMSDDADLLSDIINKFDVTPFDV